MIDKKKNLISLLEIIRETKFSCHLDDEINLKGLVCYQKTKINKNKNK